MGHGFRQPNLPAIFEAERQPPGKIVVSYGGPATLDAGRSDEASSAQVCICRLQRETAALATATDEFNRSPAIGTKAVRIVDDCTAACTSRRQGKIKHRAERSSQGADRLHPLLVADHQAAHKRPRGKTLVRHDAAPDSAGPCIPEGTSALPLRAYFPRYPGEDCARPAPVRIHLAHRLPGPWLAETACRGRSSSCGERPRRIVRQGSRGRSDGRRC